MTNPNNNSQSSSEQLQILHSFTNLPREIQSHIFETACRDIFKRQIVYLGRSSDNQDLAVLNRSELFDKEPMERA